MILIGVKTETDTTHFIVSLIGKIMFFILHEKALLMVKMFSRVYNGYFIEVILSCSVILLKSKVMKADERSRRVSCN